MTNIGLVVRPGNEQALELGKELLRWSAKHNHRVLFEQKSAEMYGAEGLVVEELVRKADPIAILGGDGTMIGVARYVGQSSPLLVGVNFGTLGFLTELSPQDLLPVIERLVSGDKKIEIAERSLLRCEVLRDEKRKERCVFSSQAVNDVVIQKAAHNRLLDLDVAVNGEDVVRVRSDGLIIATPTGSTAYSLAAGGSIVHPELDVCLVTPICAHSLTLRPLVLGLSNVIEVRVPQYDGHVVAVADGQVRVDLHPGDRVHVTKSKFKVRFVNSPHKSYFGILRGKLNWGIANRSE
ncbi:MAG: NAD(+)/NADH kinase [Oligoflexia bacterium]|nr:NAD(+)/NADH kinase [Oligoflexia bacterium]